MRIVSDIDNVVGNFQPWWAERWFQWWGQRIDPAKLASWDAYRDATGVPDAGFFWEWAKVAKVWQDMPLVPGAQGTLWALSQRGHLIDFVTSRSKDISSDTRWWLNMHFGFLMKNPDYRSHVEHVPAESKDLVPGDLYLDDSPVVLRSLVDKGLTAVRFECPWNVDAPYSHSVASWRDFEDLVNDIEDGTAS